ncbi:MAG: AbrB/MazE/SpoVT family DNA-binding domain-containing protein [Dehalococcoidia bacterium]
MRSRVQKWGNSLAVRIPKAFAEQAGLAENVSVHLSLAEGKVLIEPVRSDGFTLDQLLAGVTEANRHAEVETGQPVGNEVW